MYVGQEQKTSFGMLMVINMPKLVFVEVEGGQSIIYKCREQFLLLLAHEKQKWVN